MNYQLNFGKTFNTSIVYNETQSEAFSSLSNDTQSLVMDISKKINENIKLSINTNFDIKNN